MKRDKVPTFQKAKSNLAQGIHVIVRALTVNTSSMLKGKLRPSLKQCSDKLI